MGNISSGHFKPTNNIQEKHNDRTLSPSYLLPEEFRGKNEVNRSSTQAIELKERIIENAKETYLITFKQKNQAKSYLWSLVVNIKTNTTMSDLEKLAEHFGLKYGFQCYQIAIHRDEGYIDENNQPHTNHHAHMEFVTLGKENGKNMMRQISPVKLGQIQTEIAQILGMERGTPKRISGTERIEPRKYAQMKNKERKALNTLKQEKTTLESIIQEKDNEIATALDTANIDFPKKIPTLQEAVRRIHQQAEILSAIYNLLNQTAHNYVSELTEKHKKVEFFTKTFDIVKKLKELYSKIVEKLFGDENAKKDNQDILNTITELQERPTKQQLETLKQEKDKEIATLKQEKTTLEKNSSNLALDLEKAQDQIKTLERKKFWLESDLSALESNVKFRTKVNQEKNKEIDTLKQEKTTLEKNSSNLALDLEKAQDQIKTLERKKFWLESDLSALESNVKFRTKVNQEKNKEIDTLKQEKTTLEKNSSNLALDLEKAQDQIKTLESNENTLKNDLNAKESVIQAKEKTINELKKQIQEQEYKYTQERERMKAENKRLQEQGLDKRYTQKDYENLKKQYADEIEALKKKIQEQNKYRIQANALRYRQAQQRRAKTPTPTPSTPTPQPTYTPTKRM